LSPRLNTTIQAMGGAQNLIGDWTTDNWEVRTFKSDYTYVRILSTPLGLRGATLKGINANTSKPVRVCPDTGDGVVLYLTTEDGTEKAIHVLCDGNQMSIASGVTGTNFYSFHRPVQVPNASSIASGGLAARPDSGSGIH